MDKEIWKDINKYEGYYQISNYGNVRSLDRYVTANKNGGIKLLNGKIMKLTISKDYRDKSKNGYVVVQLSRTPIREVYLVHQLVAEHFIENPNNYKVINHIDGNKQNNHYTNLEWCTYSENNQHAINNELRNPRGIEVVQYNINYEEINRFKSASEASRITGFGRGSICHCLTNRIESYKGYIWKYANTVRSNDYPSGVQ